MSATIDTLAFDRGQPEPGPGNILAPGIPFARGFVRTPIQASKNHMIKFATGPRNTYTDVLL